MGWCYTYSYGEKDRKKLVIKEVIGEKNIDKIHYIEVRGADVWVIMNDENGKPSCGFLVLTSLKHGEFGYKDIGITACPYSVSCSKRFRNMVEEIYADYLKEKENEECYLKSWLKLYDDNEHNKKEKKSKLDDLKNGDIIEFATARYGGKNKFVITKLDGANTIFNGYTRLRAWRKQDFRVVGGSIFSNVEKFAKEFDLNETDSNTILSYMTRKNENLETIEECIEEYKNSGFIAQDFEELLDYYSECIKEEVEGFAKNHAVELSDGRLFVY